MVSGRPDWFCEEMCIRDRRQGVLRYSIVTSGRKLSDREVDQVCESIRAIREQVGIEVCVSFGLLPDGPDALTDPVSYTHLQR